MLVSTRNVEGPIVGGLRDESACQYTRLIGGERLPATLPQYLVNMTMLNGCAGVRSIDSAYWSVFVELRFYVLVTMVLLLGQIQRIQPLLNG